MDKVKDYSIAMSHVVSCKASGFREPLFQQPITYHMVRTSVQEVAFICLRDAVPLLLRVLYSNNTYIEAR
jgi:hypothetical protein